MLISISVVKIETNHIVTKQVNITINALVAPTRKNKPILSENSMFVLSFFFAILLEEVLVYYKDYYYPKKLMLIAWNTGVLVVLVVLK